VVIESVLGEALKLSDAERAELVERLLDSLPDSGHQAAWTEVIERRAHKVRSGNAVLVEADVAIAQVREALAARRQR
jgi:putative addiction module component (TIGR02574 family)